MSAATVAMSAADAAAKASAASLIAVQSAKQKRAVFALVVGIAANSATLAADAANKAARFAASAVEELHNVTVFALRTQSLFRGFLVRKREKEHTWMIENADTPLYEKHDKLEDQINSELGLDHLQSDDDSDHDEFQYYSSEEEEEEEPDFWC